MIALDDVSWRPGSNRFIIALGDASWKNDLTSDADAIAALTDNNANLIGLRFSDYDFSDPDSLEDKVLDLVARHRVDILVNNTGGPPGGSAPAPSCSTSAGSEGSRARRLRRRSTRLRPEMEA